jgi:hypothetical protein
MTLLKRMISNRHCGKGDRFVRISPKWYRSLASCLWIILLIYNRLSTWYLLVEIRNSQRLTTVQKQLTHAAQAAERAKSEFLAIMSHENPDTDERSHRNDEHSCRFGTRRYAAQLREHHQHQRRIA